jgi:hypothetical protein
MSRGGTSALLVSKLHKLRERLAEREQCRVDAKDALDALRLLRAVPTADMARTFDTLTHTAISEVVTREALDALRGLFADAQGLGCQLAVQAAGPLADPGEIAGSCSILARDLLNATGR